MTSKNLFLLLRNFVGRYHKWISPTAAILVTGKGKRYPASLRSFITIFLQNFKSKKFQLNHEIILAVGSLLGMFYPRGFHLIRCHTWEIFRDHEYVF